mmetsp:Transcript_19574/g.42522  ORF Transcript_19574/g.42522 Transcript_19574/m.42522 type:complete len:145 (-) Transcript_19574:61-495(-)
MWGCTLNDGWVANDAGGVETFGHGKDRVVVGNFRGFVIAVNVVHGTFFHGIVIIWSLTLEEAVDGVVFLFWLVPGWWRPEISIHDLVVLYLIDVILNFACRYDSPSTSTHAVCQQMWIKEDTFYGSTFHAMNREQSLIALQTLW